MKLNLKKELAALEKMTVGELHQRYADVFGETPRSRHKQYLIRRIAWRLQANAEGGLSDRALRRAEELANVADVRVTPPKNGVAAITKKQPQSCDPRLPPVGASLVRDYKGGSIAVTVLDGGFEYEGERYRSLSAVAKTITGSHISGFRFFGLKGAR